MQIAMHTWMRVEPLALADDVGSRHVGIILDAFHLNIEEVDSLGAIRQAGARLIDFHVADNNRRPPGEGALEWEQILRTLCHAGYDGCLSVEFVLPMDRTPHRQEADAIHVSNDEYLRVHSSGDVSPQYYDLCVERAVTYLRGLLAEAPALPGGRPDELQSLMYTQA